MISNKYFKPSEKSLKQLEVLLEDFDIEEYKANNTSVVDKIENNQAYHFRFNHELMEQFDKIAHLQNKNRSKLIKELIYNYLEENKHLLDQ